MTLIPFPNQLTRRSNFIKSESDPLLQAILQEVQVPAKAQDTSRTLADAHRAPPTVAVRTLASAVWARPSNGSRMTRECHVRFCESAEVQSLRATHLVMAFESEADARKVLFDFAERMAKFSLALH